MKRLFIILFVVLLLLSSCSVKPKRDYEEEYPLLEDKYDQIYGLYDDLVYQIGNLEEDVATVYCFFEEEEDVTFKEAKSSFEKIRTLLDSVYCPAY